MKKIWQWFSIFLKCIDAANNECVKDNSKTFLHFVQAGREAVVWKCFFYQNLAKSTGKHLCHSPFFNKVASADKKFINSKLLYFVVWFDEHDLAIVIRKQGSGQSNNRDIQMWLQTIYDNIHLRQINKDTSLVMGLTIF